MCLFVWIYWPPCSHGLRVVYNIKTINIVIKKLSFYFPEYHSMVELNEGHAFYLSFVSFGRVGWDVIGIANVKVHLLSQESLTLLNLGHIWNFETREQVPSQNGYHVAWATMKGYREARPVKTLGDPKSSDTLWWKQLFLSKCCLQTQGDVSWLFWSSSCSSETDRSQNWLFAWGTDALSKKEISTRKHIGEQHGTHTYHWAE